MVRPDMSEHTELDPSLRHRHDIGEVDHGAHTTERVTKNLQGILGALILMTIGLIVYAMVLAVTKSPAP